jgi:hypothetical protein
MMAFVADLPWSAPEQHAGGIRADGEPLVPLRGQAEAAVVDDQQEVCDDASISILQNDGR